MGCRGELIRDVDGDRLLSVGPHGGEQVAWSRDRSLQYLPDGGLGSIHPPRRALGQPW